MELAFNSNIQAISSPCGFLGGKELEKQGQLRECTDGLRGAATNTFTQLPRALLIYLSARKD